ncbi:HlyD family secretion protein [Brevibacillus fluminis]|uniref:HlyD family secretion protein n=1 Tax=Brevibacillus fluminis TaxID=511487 RepID=A0A3M8CXB0_9BACL|nr:HlyD family efflux transporter periplasmic adaptor subunit [Brevibacillus fluminis]RNB80119.1 HlyD family secretion protein [Brevibacillus fluminis]
MKKKGSLYVILILMVLVCGGVGGYYWYQGANYISTEDARLTGDIYRVMPKMSGKLMQLNVQEGDSVIADQPVGQVDSSNLATNLLDNAVLRAPITGKVIKTQAKVGEVVAAGQPIAMVVDKNSLYLSANIEETNLSRLHVGEVVDFTVDAFPGNHFTGKLSEIGEATNSTFSLLPATSTSGNFTKVTQRIPIKIAIDSTNGIELSPGMSAVIKIHVKGN